MLSSFIGAQKYEKKGEVKSMKQREYGLDVARIISMLGILVLHILGRCGLLQSYEPTSVRY